MHREKWKSRKEIGCKASNTNKVRNSFGIIWERVLHKENTNYTENWERWQKQRIVPVIYTRRREWESRHWRIKPLRFQTWDSESCRMRRGAEARVKGWQGKWPRDAIHSLAGLAILGYSWVILHFDVFFRCWVMYYTSFGSYLIGFLTCWQRTLMALKN